MSFRVWQLLAEIKIPAKSIDLEEGQRSARLVVEAVQPLDIAPEVLNRISQSIFVALKNAVWKLKPSRESTGAAILIYCPVGNSPDEPDVPLGWGFFMVERLENSLEAGSERARYAIELFLYPSL